MNATVKVGQFISTLYFPSYKKCLSEFCKASTVLFQSNHNRERNQIDIGSAAGRLAIGHTFTGGGPTWWGQSTLWPPTENRNSNQNSLH